MCNLRFNLCKRLLCLSLYVVILISGKVAFGADICREGLKELHNSQGVIQDKGGIWGYLEQSQNLRSESILGLQIDGKLQRLITIFENLCNEGKIPTASLHALIRNLLGDARMVFNRAGNRRKKEQFIVNLKKLHNKTNELLAKVPN